MNERTNHIHILNSYLCPNTPDMDSIVVKDSNGTVLKEGDAVILTKSLDPKGTS
ncbi:MAG: PhnA domain, partial [Bacteroidota bacterium]